MKTSRIVNIVFIFCCFMSCQAKKENSNVVLTDFTKELVSMYINDLDNLEAKKGKDEIIVISLVDTLHHYLSVFSHDSKSFTFCREDYIGQTLHLGHLIRVFGDEDSIFYSLKEKNKRLKKCKQNTIIYDPKIWQVCLNKDQSFCKMRTYKVSVNEDISTIQNLAEKYFKTSKTIGNEVYQSHEVENDPKFLLGEDSLRHLISSNFKVKRDSIKDKIPVVIDILIDKNGKATLKGIIKSSNDKGINNEALRIAEIVCQYDFIPASHRGEKVNVIYPIVFLRSDIVP